MLVETLNPAQSIQQLMLELAALNLMIILALSYNMWIVIIPMYCIVASQMLDVFVSIDIMYHCMCNNVNVLFCEVLVFNLNAIVNTDQFKSDGPI